MTKHFEKEIERLRQKILHLAAMVEEKLRAAVDSISKHDLNLAQEVIDTDSEIDSYEVEVEEECLKILALHQPVATDLRYVVATLKINSDLERIADLAVNIAERTMTVAKYPNVTCPFDLQEMLTVATEMVKFSVDSLIQNSAQLAWRVIRDDDKIDGQNAYVYKAVRERIRKDPENAEYYISLLSVSRNLERIGDHATNIAEDIIYMIDGEIVRHQEPADVPAHRKMET